MARALLTGTMSRRHVPDWLPLERLLQSDDLCGQFMWMFQVVLANGEVLNAYKHRLTRRYLHIGPDGTAYCFVGEHHYLELSMRRLLTEVFAGPGAWETTASERQALANALERCRT